MKQVEQFLHTERPNWKNVIYRDVQRLLLQIQLKEVGLLVTSTGITLLSLGGVGFTRVFLLRGKQS